MSVIPFLFATGVILPVEDRQGNYDCACTNCKLNPRAKGTVTGPAKKMTQHLFDTGYLTKTQDGQFWAHKDRKWVQNDNGVGGKWCDPDSSTKPSKHTTSPALKDAKFPNPSSQTGEAVPRSLDSATNDISRIDRPTVVSYRDAALRPADDSLDDGTLQEMVSTLEGLSGNGVQNFCNKPDIVPESQGKQFIPEASDSMYSNFYPFQQIDGTLRIDRVLAFVVRDRHIFAIEPFNGVQMMKWIGPEAPQMNC